MREGLGEHRAEWAAPKLTTADKELLEKFIDAHERGDAAAAAAISAQDIRVWIVAARIGIQHAARLIQHR